MQDLINQKPCVVETPQGFSVSYKNRYLYSKYAPSKLIVQKINSLQILPGSVILCNSPALCYGLLELIEKIPENCLIYLCEFDAELRNLTLSSEIYNKIKDNPLIIFPDVNELYDLPISIFNLASSSYAGKLKRVIAVNFSSGTQFVNDLYKKLEDACINSIKTFWTNRLTLTKFGRKYSRNFFTNLQNLKNTIPIKSYFNKVTKPILVFGAGQSVDYFFNKYKISKDNYFILCVDTIMVSLIDRGIIPDGVFVEEAQTVISKAFICKKYDIQLFTGLSSIPLLSQYFKNENISYFTTEFTKAEFINKKVKENLLPPINPPFGSVGLTSVYYALKFRKDISVPIYLVGLDFSYSTGYTHGKGTLAHVTRLINTNKLVPVENYGAAFSSSSMKVYDKNNNIFITTPSLSGYCNLFNNMFYKEKNIFDVSDCGLPLAVSRCTLPNITASKKTEDKITKETYPKEFSKAIDKSIKKEIDELKYLKSLLVGEIELDSDKLETEITTLMKDKEYLYLHYADGYCFTYNQSFLNRIRTEIDFFLTIFE